MHKAASIELGPYQLLDRVGEGGSGQVHRARGPAGVVAIKLLGPASDMDEAARARFAREIAALGQLTHPHLVPLLDHGVDAELGPYLVLPLLAGTTLRAVCGGRALCPEAALLLLEPIAQATAALHAAGFVHRDLKPENVIASPDGAVTVIDLGLAWREGMTRHTDTGAAVGSVGYMSPEQIEGRPVDARADVWALGVMLHEWIAGKRPFARERPAEEAAAMLLGVHPRLTAVSRRADDALADLVARCLALDPARRPSAAEVTAAIANALDGIVTGDRATERAAVIADPIAYERRIAPARVRQLTRVARAALDRGEPFAALAACDRGLAYAPDDAALLELVHAAETPAAASTTAPASTPTARRARWPWLLGVLLAAWFAGLAVYVSRSGHTPREREPEPAPTFTMGSGATDEDRRLAGQIVSLFGRALDQASTGPSEPSATATGPAPTTASGWLRRASTQAPADAVVSIRQALALNPGWIDAQLALCVALAAGKDPGALSACDVALTRRPDDVGALAARGAARLEAGDATRALVDLDRLVTLDPDPRWRRLRARARDAAGDRDGAARDRAHACELGDAAACTPAP